MLMIVCLCHRGNDFHKEFARLHEVRSLLPPSVNLMALTAAASRKNRVFDVFEGLVLATRGIPENV